MSELPSLRFGDLLRRYRAAAGLTQAELAERAGLSVRGINDLERSARHTPRKETVVLLADALRLTDDERARFTSASRPTPASHADATPAGALAPDLPTAAVTPTAAIHTFLIADLRGYSTFTLEYGDEAAARLVSTFARLARAGVETYGGRVIELRGDEALAVFNSVRQALRAAVELQAQFAAASRADPTLPLAVGIGLDAGEAVPVEGGFRGSALNLAARLCSLAGPSEVLVSAELVHLARKVAGLAYLERGTAQLKGFADPVMVIRVLPAETAAIQVKSDAGASQDAPAAVEDHAPVVPLPLPIGGFLGALPDGPVVARDEELAELDALLDTVAAGAGRLVMLAGEPGVGKTRLAQEVMLAARNRDWLIATGRCYEPQEIVAYFPFYEVLSAAYAAAPLGLRSELPRRWSEVARLFPEQVWHSTASARPAGAQGSIPEDDQPRLFWQIASFVEALGGQRPVALLLDDLHWADSASLALLQYLARHTRASRVLLLGTYRDVEVSRHHALEAALRDLHREHLVTRFAIRRLPRAGTALLAAATIGLEQISDEFAELLHSRTEGNPFFTQEVLRALVERGDLFLRDGRWDRRAIAEIEVPESVRSTVGERVAKLGPQTQEILRAASVLGQPFRFNELQALGGWAEDVLEAALDEAGAAGLVREAGRTGYLFNHALTQQALYADLSARQRRRLHLAAGDAIEQEPAQERDRRSAELAWHLLEADDAARALPYTLLAGDQAAAVYAHTEAERHFRMARDLARELEDRPREAEALEKLGVALSAQARFDAAMELLELAQARYQVEGDAEGRGRVLTQIGWALAEQGMPGEGIARLQAEFAGAHAFSPSTQARMYLTLAQLYFVNGRYLDEAEAAAEAERHARAAGDERLELRALYHRATAIGKAGDETEDARLCELIIPRAEALHDYWSLGRVHHGLAVVYGRGAGRFALARQHWEQAIAAYERLGSPTELAAGLLVQAVNLGYHSGDWARWRAGVEQAKELLRDIPMSWRRAYLLLMSGALDLCEGRVEAAREQFRQVRALAEPSRDIQALRGVEVFESELDLLEGRPEQVCARLEPLLDRPGEETDDVTLFLHELAWAALDLGDDSRAEAVIAEGIARAECGSQNLALVDLRRIQGMILLRQRRWDVAATALDESLAASRAYPYVPAEVKALYVYGQLHAVRGELARARECWQQALAICQRMGEGLYRPRIEQALAEL
jgi:predicted ATPase/class 3 adenylate cyclase